MTTEGILKMSTVEERSIDDDFSRDGDDLLGNTEHDKGHERKQVEQLTLKETRNMRIWKVLVFTLIMLGACLVSAGTYFFVKKTETEEFEHTYEQFVDTIREALSFRVAGIVQSLQAEANYMSSQAAVSNQTFPFVTIGMFEIEGLSVRVSSKVEGTVFTPLLEPTVQALQEWNEYSTRAQGWLASSRQAFEASPDALPHSFSPTEESSLITPFIAVPNAQGSLVPKVVDDSVEPMPVAPWWQMSPPPYDASSTINQDLLSYPEAQTLYKALTEAREGVFGPISELGIFASGFAKTLVMEELRDGDQLLGEKSADLLTRRTLTKEPAGEDNGDDNQYHPLSIFMQPVFSDMFDPQSKMVGILHALIHWDAFMVSLLPPTVDGIRVVLRNDCDQVYTYEVNGPNAVFIGAGEFREEKYEPHFRFDLPFNRLQFPETTPYIEGHCSYTFSIYPTKFFEEDFRTPLPLALTLIIGGMFFLMVVTFGAYDFLVHRRNRKIVDAAAKFNSIVSSLFPENVRERLFVDAEEKMRKKETIQAFKGIDDFIASEGSFNGDHETANDGGRPIADLFPETTILFADIAGFTAWSSTREPTQVFQLLESIYANFDKIAERRGVYKIETIGDCYVAVVGLPKPRPDHAVAMVKFARECMNSMRMLMQKLEMTLGPDTSTLAMRMGIHSGPVTAGVLRGDRARFQLFGDTMNTASRMESTGLRDKIQVSQETAELLFAGGKSRWATPREDKVVAKGKGELQTYWISCSPTSSSGTSPTGTADVSETVWTESESDFDPLPEKLRRSIKWNAEILGQLLKQVVAARPSNTMGSVEANAHEPSNGMTVLDEVTEIIDLSPFSESKGTPHLAVLDQQVVDQLQDFVTAVALLYRANPFHNFEHASHVTMSVLKLMSRISDGNQGPDVATIHGFNSDPLTPFSCVFAALIHDIDHPGVPNQILIQEESALAQHYKHRSVAEQHSFDLAWGLLMENRYKDLRSTIYQTSAEKRRFRQLVVNAVMATDIMDKELKALRDNRWERAFSTNLPPQLDEPLSDTINRKATIAIEHILQASDVAHTMQHWHIYRKWNQALFEECYKAWRAGRSVQDPCEYWYQGEISFFDNYIIPLAKKLKDCGVFGVSSDEYLNYAQNNRKEWQAKGQKVVLDMVEKCQTDSIEI